MIHKIANIYDVHQLLLTKFGSFDPKIVIFIKSVADNAAANLNSNYKFSIDDDYVEEFAAANEHMDSAVIHNIVGAIRSSVRKAFKDEPRLATGYYEVRAIMGYITLAYTEPSIAPKTIKLDYNVPWGSPPGTIRVKHMGNYPAGMFKFIYCDDDEECDIVIGNDIHIVTRGYYRLVDGQLAEVDLDEARNTTRTIVHKTHTPRGTVHRIITEVTTNDIMIEPRIETRRDKEILMVWEDGNYGSGHYELINVMLSPEQILRKVEYDVVINGARHTFDRGGEYIYVNDKFVRCLAVGPEVITLNDAQLEKMAYACNLDG